MTRPLGIEKPDHVLYRDRFRGERPARPLAFGVGDVPPTGDKPIEAALRAEHRLDRIMREVMQREEPPVATLLPLRGRAPVGARAVQDDLVIAALGEVDPEGRHSNLAFVSGARSLRGAAALPVHFQRSPMLQTRIPPGLAAPGRDRT